MSRPLPCPVIKRFLGYRTARYRTHDLKYQKPDDNVQTLSTQMIEAHMHAKPVPAPTLVQLQPRSQPQSPTHGGHAGHRPHQPHKAASEADSAPALT